MAAPFQPPAIAPTPAPTAAPPPAPTAVRVPGGARPGHRHRVLLRALDPLLARHLALLRFREPMDLRHVPVGDLAGDLLGRRVAAHELRIRERLGLAVVEVRLEPVEGAKE